MINRGPDLRLMTRVARLYYEEGLNQIEVARRLGFTQVAVSRLLKKAQQHGIVRTTVVTPPGAFAELEELIERRFELGQVIIGEATSDSEQGVRAAIGSAAAQFLESTLKAGEVIGISSWSASLLSMVEHMHPPRKSGNCLVVQILGGVGNPAAEQHANRLAVRLGGLVHGDVRFLPAPGVVGSARAAKVLAQDPYVRETLALFEKVTLALVGVGSLEPSELVASSGNTFSEDELEDLRKKGAVGDICLRFYDANGHEVRGTLGGRVIGMELESLRRVQRAVALCGGQRKFPAILGALRGKWVNTLITDQYTAQRLVKAQPAKPIAAASGAATPS
ncbi:MAG: sugar-binding transcriptional regulator [Verrucomicrobia bacterium]|nr:sugar-binding transcriptional regulator [Verrucomicrobiota bacterium]